MCVCVCVCVCVCLCVLLLSLTEEEVRPCMHTPYIHAYTHRAVVKCRGAADR